MISLQSIILLLGLIAVALACAPHMPQRSPQRGWCKFYVDGSSDYNKARKKRDSDSDSGSGSGSSESDGGSGGGGGKGGSGGGKGGHKYNRSKKKSTKCYEYEDGSKDDGAVLNKGVKYTVVITKGDTIVTTTAKPVEVQHGYCVFYVDGTSDVTASRKKRAASKKKFTTSKKKKDVKCYEYEDGTKDEGAVLNKGVKYTVTITKEVI
ncbi:hypothetical protein CRE_27110 [Caenorhabditis remanei]|uniref:Uncharacterized protein n=2 Tax=Caenorhabditis remanei TaxID=31234 RepID=E3LNG7_CAERE|nr:hypothetical protein CRE_27110 [Caenorhabditis remanei]